MLSQVIKNINKINMESLEKQKQPILPEGYSYHPEGYLWYILPVEKFDTLPETVEVDGRAFIKKAEFHVTVVNARGIASEIAGPDLRTMAEIETNLQKMLAEYVSKTPIEFAHFENDLRLAVSPERMSIAARCAMLNLEGYFAHIKTVYDREFPIQPPHVSIYTSTGAAVGIDSVDQMESFKKIELPAVQEVLSSI
ncbi:MAG: hypothetical protein A2648_01305 [Candidatus Lloydbacteria bacterium RIFCSPHIGHO2_01_FULL_41_20]|uniref:Uncharacterized protein n=1 Tax=Candidatus Lloydbacteria bacterium RIFCSPHIGHO2_01_FULL_41_20 TaxID=1798657 RepID=A0A1G2CU45_9BACT|nr:MAG: hypothetical protein A2648_01305 [Candidatus Lloydbacteria bacterium RIFCSPHIGHO2_01_FULL_41_20]